jgi:hypothetical protein
MLNEKQIFWNNLKRIQDSLLMNEDEFAKVLGLGTTEYNNHRKSGKLLPLNCVFEFAEKMNFHFEDLLTENFKVQSTKNVNGTFAGIPDRYAYATHSEIQPIRNIINYLEMVRGLRAKTNLIRKFQLTEDFFSNEQQKTNIFLISDIVQHLAKTYNFSTEEFIAMGHRTPFVSKSTFLHDKLSTPDTITDVVSIFFEECTHLFDKNYHYRISSMDNEQAIIEALPRKHVLKELMIKSLDFGNEKVCLTRMGVISSMSYYKYGINAPISKISSLQAGDKSNKYVLDLRPFKKLTGPANLTLIHTSPIYH